MEFSNIKLTGVDFGQTKRQWMPLEMHIVTAKSLNPQYYHLQKPELPDYISTTDAETRYTTLIPVSRTTDGKLVWQCFVRQNVDWKPETYFSEISDHYVRKWDYTYQKLTPLPDVQSFQPWLIAPNLIYNCAIEQIASGMEYTVASAKNAGRWLAQKNSRPCLGLCL